MNMNICTGVYNGNPALCKVVPRNAHFVAHNGQRVDLALTEVEWCKKLLQLCGEGGGCRHIVELYDLVVEQFSVAIIMRRYERSLSDWLSQQDDPVRSSPVVRYLLEGVTEGARFLHRHGMIHGDIHPGNIAVGTHGHAVLLDLGGVQRIGGPIHTVNWYYSLLGLGSPAVPAQDLFAIAVVTYEVFGGPTIPTRLITAKGDAGLRALDDYMHTSHPDVEEIRGVSLHRIASEKEQKAHLLLKDETPQPTTIKRWRVRANTTPPPQEGHSTSTHYA